MKDSIQNIDLVERYFDNEMTEDEKVTFNEQLKSDVELKHLFDREKLLINTVRFGAAKNHLDFFKELEKSLPTVDVEQKNATWVYYAAAASITIAIVAGIFLLRTTEPTPAELYAEYFTPHPNSFEPIVRGTDELTPRAKAFQKYEEGDYQQAAALFSELLGENREPEILLLLGNANLAVGKTEDAKSNFNEVIRISENLKAAAEWYLSLCYLKNGETEAGMEILKSLATSDSKYAPKAQDLITRLTE